MKRIFLYILTATLSILGAQASEQSDAPWYYTISTPNGGDVVTTEENGVMVTQNYAKTKLYKLDAETDGIRFTVVDTNQPTKVNGFCYFVLGEFRVLEHLPPKKTGVCLLYCFVLSPLITLGLSPTTISLSLSKS